MAKSSGSFKGQGKGWNKSADKPKRATRQRQYRQTVTASLSPRALSMARLVTQLDDECFSALEALVKVFQLPGEWPRRKEMRAWYAEQSPRIQETVKLAWSDKPRMAYLFA